MRPVPYQPVARLVRWGGRFGRPSWRRKAVSAMVVGGLLLLALFEVRLSSGQAAPTGEHLWAVEQQCNGPLDNAGASLGGGRRGFDGKMAACDLHAGPGGAVWSFTRFEASRAIAIQAVQFQIKLFASDWDASDNAVLQLSIDGGASWNLLEVFNAQNPLPRRPALKQYDVSGLAHSPEALARAQVRITSGVDGQPGGEFTLHVDGLCLETAGEMPAGANQPPARSQPPGPLKNNGLKPRSIRIARPTPVLPPFQPPVPPASAPTASPRPTESEHSDTPEPTQQEHHRPTPTPTVSGSATATPALPSPTPTWSMPSVTPEASPTNSGLIRPTATLTGTITPAPALTPTYTPGPETTLTPTMTVTTVPTATATSAVTPFPADTSTPTPLSTQTITDTISGTPTPAATPTPLPPTPMPELPGAQKLWAVEQQCSFPLANAGASLDLQFNQSSATCGGAYSEQAGQWHLTAFQHSDYTHVDHAMLYVRFAFSGWVDDIIHLEIFDGKQWYQLEEFALDKRIPPGNLATLSFDIFPQLYTAEWLNQAELRFVGGSAVGEPDDLVITLDAAYVSVTGGYPAEISLPPIPTPSGNMLRTASMAAAAAGSDPHSDRGVTADGCAGCHRSHAGLGPKARAAWPEELVCFACHASVGPGTNVQAVFSGVQNSAGRIFKHDVSLANSVHRQNEAQPGDFAGAARHIECEDCHQPHRSARGAASAPMLKPEMNSITGVDPVWSAAGTPASFSWMGSAQREYQVCFKCHSTYTSLPAYTPDGWNGSAFVTDGLRKLTSANTAQVRDGRDLSREINPYQASFHPVAAQGRNQNIPAGSFVNGWSQTSLVYCSDCHENPNPASGGKGPHGSPMLHLLEGQTNYSTVMQSGAPRQASSQVCYKCHDYQTYYMGQTNNTHFRYHGYHMDNSWGTTCYTCHDSHGSEQLHLINFDTSVVTPGNGKNSQTAWYYDQATGRSGCYVSCHGESHTPKEYTP